MNLSDFLPLFMHATYVNEDEFKNKLMMKKHQMDLRSVRSMTGALAVLSEESYQNSSQSPYPASQIKCIPSQRVKIWMRSRFY